MNTPIALRSQPSRRPFSAAWTRMKDWLGRRAARMHRGHRARRAVDEMMALDDRMLSDIGISRGSIGFAARHGHLPFEQAPLGLRSLIAMPQARREEDRY